MKQFGRITVLLGILSFLLAAAALAQPAAPGVQPAPPKPGMGGHGQGQVMHYDPQTVETLKGEVTKVEISSRRFQTVHLELKTGKETVFVFLSPDSFLQQQKLTLAPGDKVEVTGSRIKHPQVALILAGEVKKGNQAVKFRDEKGQPLWPRGMQRR